MANLDLGAIQVTSLDIGAIQGPGGPLPDVTESVSDTLVFSDSPGEGRGYLFSDTLVLADALGIVSGAFGEQFGDSLFIKDSVTIDFIYSPPGGQRGNIDYDQIRLSARAGTGAKLHTLTGSVTTGHGVVFDANGNLVDSGAAPSANSVIGTAIFSATGGTIANTYYSGVVTSVTRLSTGRFTVNLSPNQINFTVAITCSDDNAQAMFCYFSGTPDFNTSLSSFTFFTFAFGASAPRDAGINCVTVIKL